MVSSVCDPSPACQPVRPGADFWLNALPQVSSAISHTMTSQDMFLIVLAVVVLLAALVVYPAVWSKKTFRRKAALDVLERFLRWRRL